MKELSVNDLAKRFNVAPRTVSGWIWANKFPNARKVTPPVGSAYWVVPESDLENFTKPEGRGRPLSDKPSASALLKRQQRAKETK